MKKLIIALGCVLLFARQSYGQDAPTMYTLYEDHVIPSKDAQYKEGLKKLKAACEQNKIDVSWTSFKFDDNTYIHSVPIKGFADLDKNPFATLETKIGKENVGALFNALDQCVESQSSSVIMRMPNLSYLASIADDKFREVTYWFPESGKETEAEKIMMEWKQISKAKKLPDGFSTYKIFFGSNM